MNDVYMLMYKGGLMLVIFFLLLTVFLFFWLKIPKVFDELTGRSEKKGIRNIREHDDFAGVMSKRERDKYYARESEKIKVKKSSYSYTGNTGFLDKSKKDKTSGMLKRKKGDMESFNEDTSDELKFSQSETLKAKSENVDFAVDNSDPETGLLYSSDKGDTLIGVDKKPGDNKDAEDATAVLAEENSNEVEESESETSVLLNGEDSSDEEETSVLTDENVASVGDDVDIDVDEETSILSEDEETSILSEEEDTSVLVSEEETSVLTESVEEADIDKNVEEDKTSDNVKKTTESKHKDVKVIYDIVVVHSDESI